MATKVNCMGKTRRIRTEPSAASNTVNNEKKVSNETKTGIELELAADVPNCVKTT